MRNIITLKVVFIGILIGIVCLFSFNIFNSSKTAYKPHPRLYGVSFSPSYAQSFGLDWKEVYLSTLDDLGIKYLRLPTYWFKTEPQRGFYNFSDIDFMLDEAKKHNAQVLLVLGVKQPRWPECFIPNWAENLSLEEKSSRALDFTKSVVERYKSNPTIWGWQVENEPLFDFGKICNPPNPSFLRDEVHLVRNLDTRPIVITDSGEWNAGIIPMSLSDIFGTSVYRTAKNPILGQINYPFSPEYYSLKSKIIRSLFAPSNQKTILSELQAEPWSDIGLSKENPPTAEQLFPVGNLQNNIIFAQKTGFDEIYLWGVEWWYFMKQNGHSEYWNYIKSLVK